MGFLAAWLSCSERAADKATQWSAACLDRPHFERADLRSRIAGVASGRLLLSFERSLAPGEEAEPTSLGALV